MLLLPQAEKGNVNIELDGTNTLKSGVDHAGLEKNSDGNQGKLTITDENEKRQADRHRRRCAAGIGGGLYGDGNDITITGGEITATGGDCGAGIGGERQCRRQKHHHRRRKVTATGGKGAAGIGGGFYGDGNDIIITDGKSQLPAAIMGLALVEATTAKAKTSPSPTARPLPLEVSMEQASAAAYKKWRKDHRFRRCNAEGTRRSNR